MFIRRNLIWIFLLISSLVSLAVILSCSNKPVESTEPEYQRVVPETAGQPSTAPPDLAGLDSLKLQIEANPDDPDMRFLYLVSLVDAKMYTDALEQARTLGAMGGDNQYKGIAWMNFAQIVLDDIPQDDPNRSGLVRKAMDGLWIALGWEPESIPAHLALGRLALEAGDDDKALHHLSIALAVTEIGYQLRARIAEIYIRRNEPDRARVHLEKALTLANEAEDSDAVRTINGLIRGLG
jgi:tetratricopeptide (TPR) repeat protein